MTDEERPLTPDEALTACAAQFRSYEISHRAKGTPEADAKANTNRAMAAMCDASREASRRAGPDREKMLSAVDTYVEWLRLADEVPTVENVNAAVKARVDLTDEIIRQGAFGAGRAEALKSAIAHIEHMANWIGLCARGEALGIYSFEALGEDMPGIKQALGGDGL